MRVMAWFIVPALLILLTGCGRVGIGVELEDKRGRKLEANGVTYFVPWEIYSSKTASGDNMSSTFSYEGASGTISVTDGELKVNGLSYGTVKEGDTVQLVTNGIVMVNDSARPPE